MTDRTLPLASSASTSPSPTAPSTSLSSLIAKWREDPVAFVYDVWGAVPDAWQADGLKALVTNKRLAFQACKGPGKSCLGNWAVWWFLVTHTDAKVACMSITEANLKDNLWTELALWRSRSPLLKRLFTFTKTKIECVESPSTWWCSARSFAADADSSRQADSLAGMHADNALVVLDEAGSIPPSVLAAAQGIFANDGGCKRLVMLGNPTSVSGALYHAVTKERESWWVRCITGDPDDPLRSPRISIETARQQIATYGREHPWVKVNILGQFPSQAANTLVGVDAVERAFANGRLPYGGTNQPLVFGLDVARYGDDRSVLFARRGDDAATIEPVVWRNVDNMTLASSVAAHIDTYNPAAVFVDAGGGAGVIDRLHQLGYAQVFEVNFGGQALPLPDIPPMANKRAEMWWKMAEWMKGSHVRLPDIPALVGELTMPQYQFDSKNRVALERKDALKKRLGASPDFADALALTFALPVDGGEDGGWDGTCFGKGSW